MFQADCAGTGDFDGGDDYMEYKPKKRKYSKVSKKQNDENVDPSQLEDTSYTRKKSMKMRDDGDLLETGKYLQCGECPEIMSKATISKHYQVGLGYGTWHS